MTTIPTAYEFWISRKGTEDGDICEDLIDFAKLHVQAALQAASEQAKMVDFEYSGTEKEKEMSTDSVLAGSYDEPVVIAKSSILNAYPLENIK